MGLIAQKFGTALYVRTPFFHGAQDKVLNVKVLSGVVDFMGERLIPNTTSQSGVKDAFNASTEWLRTGGDESPPVKIDGSFKGGNHTSPGYYNLSATAVDYLGTPTAVLGPNGSYVMNKLCLTETYAIGTQANIRNVWDFDVFGTVWFSQRLTAMSAFHLDYMFGAQAQKIKVNSGETLHLIVPKSNLAEGIDVTNEAAERYLPPEDWDDINDPPDHFVQEIRTSGVPQHRFVTGYYPNAVRGNLTTAMYRSIPAKVYPRGCEDVDMTPGMVREVAGYFGSYNLLA